MVDFFDRWVGSCGWRAVCREIIFFVVVVTVFGDSDWCSGRSHVENIALLICGLLIAICGSGR